MTNEVKTYIKNTLIVGCVLGMCIYIFFGLIRENNWGVGRLIWDCFAMSAGIILVDKIKGAKVFAPKLLIRDNRPCHICGATKNEPCDAGLHS